MTRPKPEDIETREQARDLAIEWQQWQSGQSLSYDEVAVWEDFFAALAERFGLAEEFRENAITGWPAATERAT